MRNGGTNAAVWYWVRRELASRWRSLVILGVLGAIAGGVALAAFAGASRTDTVFERWRVETDAPDAIVFGTQVGLFDADYSPVLALPEVVDGGAFGLSPLAIILDGQAIETLPPVDDHLYNTVARPVLASGRLPDPTRPDEVMINETAADAANLDLGSEVTIVSATDLDAFFGGGEHDGPEIPATVVGITRSSPMEIIFFGGGEAPVFYPTGAVLEGHPEVPRAPNLVVRLRPGTDVAEFHERVVEVMGDVEMPVRDLAEDDKRITHGTDLERTGLLLFGAAALVAGLLLVGQAITRLVYGVAEAVTPLRVLGMQRGHLLTGLVAPVTLAAVVTSLGTFALAVALSPVFPIGLGAKLEPDPGLAFDGWVLIPGAVAVGALVLGIAALAALRATSRRPVRPRLESRVVRRIRSAAPLPVAIGAGLALDRGQGERSLPVRPALAGAVVGVIAVVGSFGLVRGIDDALDEPVRSGQIFDTEIFGDRRVRPEEVADAVIDDPAVDAVAIQHRVPVDVGGSGLPVYGIEGLTGDTTFRLTSGRAPTAPDEAALGPATAKALDLHPGDELTIGGADGSTVTVVGLALLPQTPHTSFDQGVWMTPGGVAGLPDDLLEGTETTVAVSLVDEADLDAFAERVTATTGATELEHVFLPQDVVLLENVRNLPVYLAVFLAFLGVAALGHVLVTAARRRRHDLAVLRALGFRPAQAGACLAWQATVVAIVGLVIGIPLGIVVGRLTWKWVADSTPLLYVPPVALVVVLLAIPATLLLANALALLPARAAARVRPAQVLRTE